MRIERCNRCCSSDYKLLHNNTITCNNCGTTEPTEVWQLFGWRDIKKYPPVHSGTIFVYGKTIGRRSAIWDKVKQKIVHTPRAHEFTHWLRTPDPTKQIGMV